MFKLPSARYISNFKTSTCREIRTTGYRVENYQDPAIIMASCMKGVILLTYDEIAKFVDADAQDLKNPKPDTMLYVYEGICKTLEIDLGSQQLLFQGTHFMEDPDLHRKSGVVIHMAHILGRILQSVGFKDFQVNDICNPEPKRTRRILSILVSFMQYYMVKLPKISAAKESTSEVLEHCDEIEARSEMLRREINDKQANLTERRNALKDTASRETEFDELQNRRAEVQQEYGALKNKILELETALSNQRLMKSQNEERKQELLQTIVQSPERVQTEMQQRLREINAAIAEQKSLREEIATLLSNRQDLQVLEATLVEASVNASSAADAMKRLKIQWQKSMELEKCQQTLRQQMEEMPARLEVQQKKTLMQQKISSKQISQVKARINDKKQQCKEKERKLKELQVKKKEHDKQHARLDEQAEELRKAIQDVEESIQYIREEGEKDLHTIRSWLEEAKKSREERMARLTADLQAHFTNKNCK